MLYQKIGKKIYNQYINIADKSELLPSERELASIFNVSRPTIRKALFELEESGKIKKMEGRGYIINFSSDKYIDHELDSFIGFFQDAVAQGKKISSKIIRQAIVEPYDYICQKLDLGKDDLVFVLERIRYIDDKPTCIAKSFIPLSIYPEIIDIDFTSESLFNVLEEKGLKMAFAKRSIEISNPTNLEKTYLELEANEPIFIFTSTGYAEDEKPFEYEVSKYPAFNTKFESIVSK